MKINNWFGSGHGQQRQKTRTGLDLQALGIPPIPDHMAEQFAGDTCGALLDLYVEQLEELQQQVHVSCLTAAIRFKKKHF